MVLLRFHIILLLFLKCIYLFCNIIYTLLFFSICQRYGVVCLAEKFEMREIERTSDLVHINQHLFLICFVGDYKEIRKVLLLHPINIIHTSDVLLLSFSPQQQTEFPKVSLEKEYVFMCELMSLSAEEEEGFVSIEHPINLIMTVGDILAKCRNVTS